MSTGIASTSPGAASVLAVSLLACASTSCIPQPKVSGDGTQTVSSSRSESWTLAGEFEPVDELILGWDEDFEPFFRDILIEVADEVLVTFVRDPSDSQAPLDALTEELRGLDSIGRAPARIRTHVQAIDSLWLRDFGPLTTSRNGHRRVVEMDYWNGGANDVLATQLSEDLLHLPAAHMPLSFEGGNLQVDGNGNCIASTAVLNDNPEHTEADIRRFFRTGFGCTTLHIVPPLPGEPTEHVDMFLTFTGPGELIVGRHSELGPTDGREHLDRIASDLKGKGYTVRRVPMPDQSDGLYRSYTNSLAVNSVVLVPFYQDTGADLAEVVSVFEDAYPDRRIALVDASALIELDGAIHCAAMTIPRRAL